MDAQELIGSPLLTAAVTAVTITLAAAVAWLTYSIRRATPELLQVQVFRKLNLLQNSVLAMGVALVLGMVLVTLFLAGVDLPALAWGGAGVVAGILFWYGMYEYSTVFRVPKKRPGGT